MQKNYEPVHDPNYHEASAWAEINKRVFVFRVIYNALFVAVFLAIVLSSQWREKGQPWQNVTLVLFILAVYIAVQRMAAHYPNSFRCPDCGHQFIKINPELRNPFFMVSFGKSSAICQNCGFMIRNPKRRQRRS
jgi:predicted RNA-binding Zn-ribbon protein involved in translation (DUF1610 family)